MKMNRKGRNVTLVGAGQVGLVTGVCLASIGHRVLCVEMKNELLARIRKGESPFYEPKLDKMLRTALSKGNFLVTKDTTAAVTSSDMTLIAVGTPSTGGTIDLSQVSKVSEQVGLALRGVSRYHVVAVKSTIVPGTTDTLVRSILEEISGRHLGEFGLCVNPEFLREGSAVDDFMEPDRIVIGQWDERSGRVLANLYRTFRCPKIFTTLRNAELIKYVSNALLANLISFSNEIAALCEATAGTDVEEVMKGLHLDRRLSPKLNGRRIVPGILAYLRAGCGFGGSCLPKDLEALRNYARKKNLHPHLLDAVMTVNAERSSQLVALMKKALGPLEGLTVAVLGLAFKPGTNDLRDSPALAVMNRLLQEGAVVRAYDPVALTAARAVTDERVLLCETPQAVLEHADVAVIVTPWKEFETWNWKKFSGLMRHPVVVDGRNALRHLPWPKGVRYIGIGEVPEKENSPSFQTDLRP